MYVLFMHKLMNSFVWKCTFIQLYECWMLNYRYIWYGWAVFHLLLLLVRLGWGEIVLLFHWKCGVSIHHVLRQKNKINKKSKSLFIFNYILMEAQLLFSSYSLLISFFFDIISENHFHISFSFCSHSHFFPPPTFTFALNFL